LRESKGQQVAIEARFLFVTENFLEDIGIDTGILIKQTGSLTDNVVLDQSSYGYTKAGASSVPGSIAGTSTTSNTITSDGTNPFGINLFNDNLQLTFLIRATQTHRDAKMLTAPRITVLSGERANIRLLKNSSYVSDYEFEDITSDESTVTKTIANPTSEWIQGGVTLNVTPTITSDKKYVVLLIIANYTQVNLDASSVVYSDTTGDAYSITLPTSEVADVRTRVSVPDGGTLMIGGQKLGAEINKESGVPGMSKVPLIGRLFSNRSKVKDQDILLILVKPTIIIPQEAEQEYFAPLEEK